MPRTNKVEDRHKALESGGQFSVELNDQSSDEHHNVTTGSSLVVSTQTDIPEVDTHFNLYVYAGLLVALIALSLARAILFFKLAVTAGENLHNMMFARILRTTMAFFDTNPVGECT